MKNWFRRLWLWLNTPRKATLPPPVIERHHDQEARGREGFKVIQTAIREVLQEELKPVRSLIDSLLFMTDLGQARARRGTVSLWSTYELRGRVENAVCRLFNTPLGQVGQELDRALSIAETNLKEAGRIPGGMAFSIRGVIVELLGDPGDCAAVRDHGVLCFAFLQTIFEICSLGSMEWQGQRASWSFELKPTAIAEEEPAEEPEEEPGEDDPGLPPAVPFYSHSTARRVIRVLDSSVELPAGTTFGLFLRIGSSAPELQRPVRVRVTLYGQYKTQLAVG